MKRSTIAPLVAAFWAAFSCPAAAHDGYRWVMDNPRTSHCCGPQDCAPVDRRALKRTNGHWTINGAPVPDDAIYPSRAKDARYHACYFDPPAMTRPRCLFIPAQF